MQIDALAKSEDSPSDSATTIKGEAMTDAMTDVNTNAELDGLPHSKRGDFLKGLLNDNAPRGQN